MGASLRTVNTGPIQTNDQPLHPRPRPRHDLAAARSSSAATAASSPSAQQEFPQILPSPGHVEHDPEAIWQSQLATAQRGARASRSSPPPTSPPSASPTSAKRPILWEKATGKPVANAIVWQSRISAPICERLKAAGHEPLFRERTGLVARSLFLRHQDRAPARHARRACERGPSAAKSCSAPSIRSSSGD